jgi:hypothetical protein
VAALRRAPTLPPAADGSDGRLTCWFPLSAASVLLPTSSCLDWTLLVVTWSEPSSALTEETSGDDVVTLSSMSVSREVFLMSLASILFMVVVVTSHVMAILITIISVLTMH